MAVFVTRTVSNPLINELQGDQLTGPRHTWKMPASLGRKTIGVIAPASTPATSEPIERGLAHLRKLGFGVETWRTSFDSDGYLAGNDEMRLKELNHFLGRADIDLLFCLRGGYGSLRILDRIDYETASRNPKLLVGYSDITALQLALLARSGLKSVSGPMVAVEFAGEEAHNQPSFWELFDAQAGYEICSPTGTRLLGQQDGTCEGTLIGGNLSVLTRLIGTPFLPDLDGAILFIEDIGETPYRVDGMLAQLRLAGLLEKLGGIVFGVFSDSEPPLGKPSKSMTEVFRDYVSALSIPVAEGLLYGHLPVKNAIPIGVKARLKVNGEFASLGLLESVWPPSVTYSES